MNIEYMSHSEEANFAEMVREESEMATMFAQLMTKLEAETDYDTVAVSFSGPYSIRARVVDSPYLVEINDEEYEVWLWLCDDETDVWEFDESYDYNEEGLDSVVDTIASRLLTDEEDEDEEDWRSEMIHYGV